MTLPRITLVTPSFNQGRFIEQTIDSILSQNYPNLEYIVVDGGSSDGSVDVIRRYERHLTWWVSEADGGQTDAISKGFSRSSGLLLNWLNSDDLLRPGALMAVAECSMATGADLIVGEDLAFTTDPAQPCAHFQPAGHSFPDCLRFWDGQFRYHQPCTFFSRRALLAAGGLDSSLHYVMDYDLYCRLLALPECRVEFLSLPLSSFRLHADAKTSAHRSQFLIEQEQVSRRYWKLAGLDPSRCQRELSAYWARCRFHQASEALRQSKPLLAGLRLVDAVRSDPLALLIHAAKRMKARFS